MNPTYSTVWQLCFFEIILAAPHGILKSVCLLFLQRGRTSKQIEILQGTETGLGSPISRPVTQPTKRTSISSHNENQKLHLYSGVLWLGSHRPLRRELDWGRSGLPHVIKKLNPIIASPWKCDLPH